jgi:hypothetical protein
MSSVVLLPLNASKSQMLDYTILSDLYIYKCTAVNILIIKYFKYCTFTVLESKYRPDQPHEARLAAVQPKISQTINANANQLSVQTTQVIELNTSTQLSCWIKKMQRLDISNERLLLPLSLSCRSSIKARLHLQL